MEESPKNRIQEYLKAKRLSLSKFADNCGVDKSVVSRIGQTTSKTTLAKIENGSDINIDWLLTGEGEMLRGEDEREAEGEEEWMEEVPLLPVEAMAGSLVGMSECVELSQCRKIKSPVHGADWAIQISGDSMEPKYEHGYLLFIKRVSGKFIPWGNTMVIDTLDGVLVKNVYPCEEDDDYIEAHSINPRYPPFRIEKREVLGLYRVLGGTFVNSTL